MLYVKTKIEKSNIAGLGLFADQHIAKGTIVWKFEPKLDVLLSEGDIQKMPDAAKNQLHNYAFFDSRRNKYILCGDDGRFFNHSFTPNCDDSNNDVTVAIKNIQAGEELTVDYKTFDGHFYKHHINF